MKNDLTVCGLLGPVFVLTMVLALAPASAQPVEWVTNGDGLWTDAANWSSFPLLPGLGDDVVIDRRGEPGRPGSGWLVTLSGNSTQLIDNLLLEERLTLSGSTSLVLGGTLTANNSLLLSSGTRIIGGLITSSGSGNFSTSGGRLVGVTLGTDMLIGSGANVDIENGLTITPSGTILKNGTALNFVAGTQEIQGSGQIVFGTTTTTTRTISAAPNAQVTIGPDILIRTGTGSGNFSGSTNSSFTNLGTISSQTNGRTITLGSTSSSFTNQGLIEAINGGTVRFNGPWTNETGTISINEGTLDLDGQFQTPALGTIIRNGGNVELSGTLDNTGHALDLDTTTGPLEIRSGSVIIGGDIVSTGPATLSTSGGRLVGVTLGTDMLIGSGANVDIENGLTITPSGTILKNGTALNFVAGTQEIQGSGQIVFGTTTTTTRTISAAPNAQVTIGPDILIRTGTGSGNFSGSTNSSFTNLGTISSQTNGRTITLGSTSSSFTNQGLIEAINGGTVRFPTNALPTNLVDGVLTDGFWCLGSSSTFDFATAAITTNAADIVLDGPGSSFAALDSLQRNEGRLEVRNGRVFSTTGGLEFAATGTLVVRPTDPGAGAWVTPVSVSGTATLGGTLVVDPIGGYEPARGQAFPVIQAGGISGVFDELVYTGPVGPDEVARLFYTPTGVTFAVVCPADLALPAGLINFFDLSAFTTLFQAQDPDADFNNDGLFNFFDFSAYLDAFNNGCP
jgi:hypothetical protein